MPLLSDAALWALTVRHFGDLGPEVVNTMFQIAKAESSGDTGAYGTIAPGERSHGIWQINVGEGGNTDLADWNLNDPETNARAARIVYDRQGPTAWSTYGGTQMTSQDPIDAAIDRAMGGGGGSAPSSGDVVYNGQGEAYVWDTQNQRYKRQPSLDDPSEAADFTSQYELESLNESKRQADMQAVTTRRGQDVAAASSRYGNDLQFQSNALDRQQRGYEFEQSQALAKEQFLWQKQNDIATLEQRQKELATQQAQNARMFVLEQQNQLFLRDKLAVDTEFGNRNLQLATQNQMFNQQATVAGLQLEMTAMTAQAQQLQAQLNQEVALFNAAKAADVSMFNIDQQTKAAMFNAEGAFNAATFNEQMQFNVDQANVQNERLRQQQLQELAMSISDAAEDPGDRGRLASLILAASGEGFGGIDSELVGADLRTADSMMPLEALLRQREDVMGQDPTPFDFNPVSWTPITAGQATFTPAQAQTVPMPNFSGVQMPTPNTTPFTPVKVPQSKTTPTYDSTKQNFIASGNTNTPNNQQFVNSATGKPLTAEERAQIPDYALKSMIDSGLIKQMADGGMVEGAYISGEEGPELNIPLGDGMTLIIPNKDFKKLSKQGKTKGTPKFAEGGLFVNEGKSMYEGLLSDTDRTRAQNFLGEASRRAALGTPFDINRLQTPVFSSSPGTSPFVTDLLASLNAIQRGIPQGYFREQAALLRPVGFSEGAIGRTR